MLDRIRSVSLLFAPLLGEVPGPLWPVFLVWDGNEAVLPVHASPFCLSVLDGLFHSLRGGTNGGAGAVSGSHAAFPSLGTLGLAKLSLSG